MTEYFHRIRVLLENWYGLNHRALPWRDTTDPYKIWISEIILQQTRVLQGYQYYLRFLNAFPDIMSLACAEEEDVLKLWQGLGYYSRARNIHKAAKKIVQDFDGNFPLEYKDVKSLNGVGDYTAAAIVSFAYNQAYAAVDGNVFRVLSRLYGIATPIDTTIGKKEFTALAQNLLDKEHPGIHNQAMIEFGALQCTPKSPKCDLCPLSEYCVAFKGGVIDDLPQKKNKIKVRNRYFHYFDVRCGKKMFLYKRENGDIWEGLYELPLIETENNMKLEELITLEAFNSIIEKGEKTETKYIYSDKHVLSHQILNVSFYQIGIEKLSKSDKYLEINREDIDIYPISRLTEKYLEYICNKNK